MVNTFTHYHCTIMYHVKTYIYSMYHNMLLGVLKAFSRNSNVKYHNMCAPQLQNVIHLLATICMYDHQCN